MDREIHNDAAWPFPRYANHIENDITPKDQAIYVPSVSPSHAQMIYDGIINATYWHTTTSGHCAGRLLRQTASSTSRPSTTSFSMVVPKALRSR